MKFRASFLLIPMTIGFTLAGCEIGDDQNNGEPNNDVTDTPLDCAGVDRDATGESPPTNEPELTLSGTYRISGTVTYDASEEVTIEPGTIFLMESDSLIRFGWRSDPATLFADGTEDAPILFCGTEERPGHWTGLSFLTGTTENSYLEHVRIEDAGNEDAPALQTSVDVRLQSVTVANNAALGMQLAGLADGSADLASIDNGGVAVKLSGQNAITNFPPGEYSGNEEDIALVDGFSSSNTTFNDIGIPYRQDTERVRFGVAGGDMTSLTFEAGVEFQFCQDCLIEMGWRSDPAALFINGEEGNPVVFTSHRGEDARPGDWDGIYILTGVSSDSIIQHAEFYFGGKADEANVVVDGGNIAIENSHFANSAGYGLKIAREGDFLSLSNNTFEDNMMGDTNLVE